jgi:adenylosuccinate lyase
MAKIWQEENKFSKMLQIEILACEAYAKLGKVPKEALAQIKKKAKFDIRCIRELEEKTKHDVVAFILNISENIGAASRYLHLGLTSNDLLDTSLALQCREAADILIEDLNRLSDILAKKAKKYKRTICVARTHGVHAEPTSFGLKLVLMFDETQRNLKRISEAKEIISVGKASGAVGTYAHLEPFVEGYICKNSNLKPANISTQVIQRDRHAQYLTTLAIIGSSLEKFATEIRNLQRTEILEVEEPFTKGQKGSSAMPHKRNPVTCERICGLARVLRANALASLENISLWHERDISHSSVERIIIPDSTILLDYILNKFIQIVTNLIVYPENMRRNLEKTKGLIFSQRVLIELMDKGLRREEAYDIVQRNAMQAWERKVDFKQALVKDKAVRKYLDTKQIEECFDIGYYLRYVDRIFKRVGIS